MHSEQVLSWGIFSYKYLSSESINKIGVGKLRNLTCQLTVSDRYGYIENVNLLLG